MWRTDEGADRYRERGPKRNKGRRWAEMTHDNWRRAMALIWEARKAEQAELTVSPPGPTGIVFCGISTRYTEEPPYEIVCNTYANMDGTATAYTARHNTETDAWEMLVGPGRFEGRG